MKKIILMLMLLAPMAMMAQKFGKVNTQTIMQSMPEVSKANGELEAQQKQYANDLQANVSWLGGFLAEIIFTCVFVLVVLGATAKTNGATNNFAGLAIGLSLVLVHLVCIRYTGTSVNPARSIAPAVFQGGTALTNLWIFIVGPFIGAACAAGIWKMIDTSEK